jgi:NSS family neurotransmitter:Na+ symporter
MQTSRSGPRELFRSRAGFVLTAVGSAVGLGNMWRFPYIAAEGGGAAFVLLYVLLTVGVGIPLMLTEFSVGRLTRLSPIGALRKLSGGRWPTLGILFVATGVLILSYYSVITGWVVRYALEGVFLGFPRDPAAHFEEVTSGWVPGGFHVAVMTTTIVIVMLGVRKGIEKVSVILMPSLFAVLLLLAFWAASLSGAAEGYAFYLKPSVSELLDPAVLSRAAAQAFFSLSLGIGTMLTFASYLSEGEDLTREASIVAFSDFGVALVAGLVVFPIIFALGLQDEVSESTVGTLFIALPRAFVEMGSAGRIVGVLFFWTLFVGALTSAISLLEVVTASMMDELGVPRKHAALGAGAVIVLLGLLPATSISVLTVADKLSEVLLALGAGLLAVFVGWVATGAAEELERGASSASRRLVPILRAMIRFVLPPVIFLVAAFAAAGAWRTWLIELGG